MQYSRFVAALIVAAALPAAEFSTYIGDENTWRISKLVIDASGNTYVAGSRTFNLSLDPLRPDLRTEAVVVKLDTSGKRVLLANIGGKGTDVANAVAVDRAGNIYLAGSTTSPNFPVRSAVYPTLSPAAPGFFGTLGFITKLSPAGDILYSTYFPSIVQDIAVDSAGSAYVAGTTYIRDFPTTPSLPRGAAYAGIPIISGAFLTKIAPSGDKIVYSTVISGTNKPCGAGSSCFTSSRGASGVAVAVDASGNAYLAGNSDVIDLPTTPGVITPSGSGAFIAKVNAAGTALAYLTYLGSAARTLPPFFTPATNVRALAVDAAGNAFVAGGAWDAELTFPNRIQSPPAGAFAGKVNPVGTAYLWGAYLGGEEVSTATLDATGNLWVAGATGSTPFPNPDGWSNGEDFVVRFDPSGNTAYSARYPTETVRQTIAAGALLYTAVPSGVVSAVAASPRPAVRPWTVGPLGGKICAGQVVEIYGPHIGGPGAQVFFNDIPAPLLYSGDQQINAVVPFELDGQKSARVRIGAGPEFTAAVLPAIPQIFWPALNQDGTINSLDNPAPRGSVMTIWVTGGAPPFPPVPNGTIATGPNEYYVGTLTAGAALVGTLYAGAAPGLVAGVAQINFIAPNSGVIRLSARNHASAEFPVFIAPLP
jgi:uncharacterized protein (TIGR03437 family)